MWKPAVLPGRMEKKAAGIKLAKPLVISPGRGTRFFGD